MDRSVKTTARDCCSVRCGLYFTCSCIAQSVAGCSLWYVQNVFILINCYSFPQREKHFCCLFIISCTPSPPPPFPYLILLMEVDDSQTKPSSKYQFAIQWPLLFKTTQLGLKVWSSPVWIGVIATCLSFMLTCHKKIKKYSGIFLGGSFLFKRKITHAVWHMRSSPYSY